MRTILFLAAILLTMIPAANAGENSPRLQSFLLSTPNTYGWTPVKGGNSYDFFPDGRLHVQGSDGEATMWEGKWKLDGDRLTIVIPQLKVNQVVTASANGKDLLLDGVRYRRAE